MSYMHAFCWDCDRHVTLDCNGWYRCSHCGFESLRDYAAEALIIDRNGQRAKPAAGLVSLTHKVENK